MHIYRDVQGYLWALLDDDRLLLALSPRYVWEGPSGHEWGRVQAMYGPLVELTDDEVAEHRVGLLELIERLDRRATSFARVLTPEQAAELRELANDAVTEATRAVRGGGIAMELGTPAHRAWARLCDWIADHTDDRPG
jgi:hypothetical protein